MESETEIREAAVLRLRRIFSSQSASVRLDAVFGIDLNPTFKSDFRHNELDDVDFDIRDVANRDVKKELASGVTTITTVRDYCDHMVRCYGLAPDEVRRVLAR